MFDTTISMTEWYSVSDYQTTEKLSVIHFDTKVRYFFPKKNDKK